MERYILHSHELRDSRHNVLHKRHEDIVSHLALFRYSEHDYEHQLLVNGSSDVISCCPVLVAIHYDWVGTCVWYLILFMCCHSKMLLNRFLSLFSLKCHALVINIFYWFCVNLWAVYQHLFAAFFISLTHCNCVSTCLDAYTSAAQGLTTEAQICPCVIKLLLLQIWSMKNSHSPMFLLYLSS